MKAFFDDSDIDIGTFEKLCMKKTNLASFPFAEAVKDNVVLYKGSTLKEALKDAATERDIEAELHMCLEAGPGVLVVQGMYEDLSIIDAQTALIHSIIQDERAKGYGEGDHFGNNERVWNSFQKAALKEPSAFVAYYGNPIIALLSKAWLGPFYQITAQVNNVKPGSQAQSPHRDYHLGFQSNVDVGRFPARAQVMSQFLTLQGAIAHTDMPIESGPTRLLPYSQQYEPGYMAYSLPDFNAFFQTHHVQLPLQKGDGLFFSPALFHGAGHNVSENDRMANLLQVSSAFGRPMETIDTHAIINAVYPHLLANAAKYSARFLNDIVAAIADGYSFPTNLDTDPPQGGYAPMPESRLVHLAITEQWPANRLSDELAAYARRRA